METKNVDVAIIGAGTAGLNARRAAKAQGASVLMLDPGPHGTTCARVGCMPSKLLIAAAEHCHSAALAPEFGVDVDGVRVDSDRVLGRVRAERDRFVGFVLESIEARKEEGELIEGTATIVKPGQLSVVLKGQTEPSLTVNYKGLVIAAGGQNAVPPPFRNISYLTNETIFEIDKIPDSLLVIGIGVIGLELGQAFSRLGARTTLLGIMDLIGPIQDPKVLKCANETLREELDLHSSYELESVEPEGEGVRIRFTDSTGKKRDEHYDKVLMAAGRIPRTAGLGLEALGFEDLRKLPINPDTLQLGDQPVFFAGDVNNLHPLLHEAGDDGKAAGANAAGLTPPMERANRTPLGVVFSDPQIGVVGPGYNALELSATAAGEVDYTRQGRARVHLMNKGLVRIYGDLKSRKLVGAQMFGPRVEHTANLLAWSVQQGLTVDDALKMPFYHPVVEEGIRTALEDLRDKLDAGQAISA